MMQQYWLSFGRTRVAAHRRSCTTRSTARSTRWMRSSGPGQQSRSTGSTLNSVHLHEAVRWIVHASDQRAAVLVEPQVEAGTVGGNVGGIEVVAHARIHKHHVRGHAHETLVERHTFVGPVQWDQKRAV